ncbi:anti-sigma factor domain-containing protein [Clostridium uliginosum]|uniref:Anti-sigma factor N-terminus n=1 Tax=Clostridium uliginosum TaxID=119641 RepID=A0A1I1J234_9CLOT|nr:anti-sigma factor domain-containing protein [Clostridium uliginosum]SFC42455.1 Anti-sigma factor N-terminus [Clostridium uliginosum]
MNEFNSSKYMFSSIPGMLLIGDKAERHRNNQISLFLKELSLYKILLKDLANYPPKEKQRNIILNIAYYISENNEIVEQIIKNKSLPIGKLSKILKVNNEFLKRWKEYILAYFIIFSNADYKGIQDYFRVEERESKLQNSNLRKKTNVYRGVAMKSFKRYSYILTSSGEFIKLKTNNKPRVGQEVQGREKKSLRHYKLHISIIILLMIFMGFISYNQYWKVNSTLMINTTSSIKVEVNFLDKVIYVSSQTDKGKKLISESDLSHKNVDTVVQEVLEYAFNNDMIPIDKKVLITVNGDSLKYGTLIKTSKFINENKISVVVNNAGNQHNLSTKLYE